MNLTDFTWSEGWGRGCASGRRRRGRKSIFSDLSSFRWWLSLETLQLATCNLQLAIGQKWVLAQFISSRQTTGKVQRCRWPKTSQSYCCEFSLNVLWWRLIAEKGKYSCKLLKYHLNSMHLRDIFALQKYQLLIVKKQHNIQYQWAKRPWIPDESWLQVSRRRNKQLYTFLSCKFISQLSWSNYFRLFGNGQNVHFLSLALYPIYCTSNIS